MKKSVSKSSVSAAVELQRSMPYIGTWNSDNILKVVPRKNLCQMMHQCLVLGVKVALYCCASETGIF